MLAAPTEAQEAVMVLQRLYYWSAAFQRPRGYSAESGAQYFDYTYRYDGTCWATHDNALQSALGAARMKAGTLKFYLSEANIVLEPTGLTRTVQSGTSVPHYGDNGHLS